MLSASSLRNLLEWFDTPSILQPDAVTNEEIPAYSGDATPLTAEQIRGLKELLSPEAWLYLLHADDETPVNQFQVQRKLQAHIAQVLNLIAQGLRDESLSSPRLQACFRWVQYYLLNSSAAQVPPLYY